MPIRARVERGPRERVKTRKKNNSDNGSAPGQRVVRYQNAPVCAMHDIAFAAIAIKLKENQAPYPPGDCEIDRERFNISDHRGLLRGNHAGITLTPAHPDDPIIQLMNQMPERAVDAHHSVRDAPRHPCQSPWT